MKINNVWLLILLSATSSAFAVTYDFPNGTYTLPQDLIGGDTLNVDSGTMQVEDVTSTFTVNITNNAAQDITVNIDSGATLSFAGTFAAANTINSARSDAVTYATTINLNGVLATGTGQYALYVNNDNVLNGNTVVINHRGTVNGSIYLNGIATAINIDGAAPVNGDITSTGLSFTRTLGIGQSAITNFTTNGIITGPSITVYSGSSLTLNNPAYEIGAVTVQSNARLYVNNELGGRATADGAITNNGLLVVSEDITKTGTFTTSATGTTEIRQAVNVDTSTYDITAGTHRNVLADVLNYGSMTLGNATPNFGNFIVAYTNGYFPGTTIYLVNTNAFGTLPTSYTIPQNTMFLSFATPQVGNGAITIALTRNLFQSFVGTELTRSIGTVLEDLGASTSPSPTENMVTILNAVERSTYPAQVQSSLRQLAPIISAPLYMYQVTDEINEQVELRIAAARNAKRHKAYASGDLTLRHTMWLRPFADKANQASRDDCAGYYAATEGIAFGYDRQVYSNTLVGIAGGYATSYVRDKINNNSSTDVQSYQLLLYGSYDFRGNQYLEWLLNGAYNMYDGQRYVSIIGTNLLSYAEYTNKLFVGRGIWGTDCRVHDLVQLNPELSAEYSSFKGFQYQETQGMGANLRVTAQNSTIFEVGAGLKISMPLEHKCKVLIPELHAFGGYNLASGDQDTVASFLGGGSTFGVHMTLPRATMKLGAAFTYAIVDRLQLKFNYDWTVMSDYRDNAVYLNFKWTF